MRVALVFSAAVVSHVNSSPNTTGGGFYINRKNTMNTNQLTVCNTSIRQDADGRYFLNDLHKASGGHQKDKPVHFLKLESTQALISELEKNPTSEKINNLEPVKTVNSFSLEQGTYVVKPLVYAYAMWISAKFQLQVIRAYDALVTTNVLTIPNALTLAEFEQAQDQLARAQEALNRATLQLSVGEYEALLDQRTVYHVPGKALALMEKHGIPRDEICKAAGINRNNLRQHLHHVAKQGGAA